MKYLLLLPLLLLSACTGNYTCMAPNHFCIKPSYEIDTAGHYANVHKYKVETGLDWNW